MEAIAIFGGIVLLMAMLYLLSLRGRRNHPGFSELEKWHYAHRGLHDEALPENSMGAFQAALEQGFGIELDVHLTKDGNLAVIHDSSLKRTAGTDSAVEDLTLAEATACTLTGSQETIPAFRQVLELFDGKAPMIIELKTHKGNYAALTDRLLQELKDYSGPYCIESFDPRCIIYLKKHYPDKVRGILSCNYIKEGDKYLPRFALFLLGNLMANFLMKPDFIAYRHQHRKNLSCWLCRKFWGIRGVAWTVRTKEDHEKVISEGWISIFENFLPEK